MTRVLSMAFSAAQCLDSSCTNCWNRAVRFGRPDLLEVCANNDSPLVEAVESAGGEGLRTSFWNGYDLTARRGRERLYLFCSAKRPRHVWFSSPCRVSGASSERVSRIFARHCRRVSESASWLPCPFCTTTHFGQLEPEVFARHDDVWLARVAFRFARDRTGGPCRLLHAPFQLVALLCVFSVGFALTPRASCRGARPLLSCLRAVVETTLTPL